MKYVVIVTVILGLMACNRGGSSGSADDTEESLSMRDVDLSGTWVSYLERQAFRTDTGEYISSYFYESKYIMDDTERGVQFDSCWIGLNAFTLYGVKTEERFYMYPSELEDTGFTLLDENTLLKEYSYESPWFPTYEYQATEALVRISDGVDIDNGLFILNGPISVEEYSQVCVRRGYSNIGEGEYLQVFIPYSDGNLTFTVQIFSDISPGVYNYAQPYQDGSQIRIDITSSADEFWQVVGSNTLSPEDVTITIIQLNDERLSGTFVFTGQDDNEYSGEFEILLNQ